MDYLIGNKNGIVGIISIIEKDQKKVSVFCSFENNFFKKNPFDPDLIMQDPKSFSFDLSKDNEVIVEETLKNSIIGFNEIRESMRFYWFKDDYQERKRELEKLIASIMEKYQ